MAQDVREGGVEVGLRGRSGKGWFEAQSREYGYIKCSFISRLFVPMLYDRRSDL